MLDMIETISNGLPRLSIYERLNDDLALQTALVNIYAEVVEFSVCIFRYLKRHSIGEDGIEILRKASADEYDRTAIPNHGNTTQERSQGHQPKT